MRKFLTLIAIMLVTCIALTGCGFSSWQDDEETKTIKEINRVTDENGNVYLEIVYTDDSPKDRFLIPEGVSITGAEANYDGDKRETSVTISFSDNFPAYTFTVPDGKDGTSVNKVEIVTENGMRYLAFKYVDNEGNTIDNKEWMINIDEFKGEDGLDGATWLFGEGDPNTIDKLNAKNGDFFLDTKDYVIYVKSDNGWTKKGSIKGTGILEIKSFSDEKGSGIEIVSTEIQTDIDGNQRFDESQNPIYVSYKMYSSVMKDMKVTLNEETGNYEFNITVNGTDGEEIILDTIEVKRPSAWLSGALRPSDEEYVSGEITLVGDFYYSTKYNEIWRKESDDADAENGGWVLVVKLAAADETTYCSITFNPEGGTLSQDPNDYPAPIKNENPFNGDGSVTVKIEQGTCYPITCAIPVPEREGYVFKGWYRRKSSELTVNDGAFNTMVPVYENMVLYAIWEAVA